MCRKAVFPEDFEGWRISVGFTGPPETGIIGSEPRFFRRFRHSGVRKARKVQYKENGVIRTWSVWSMSGSGQEESEKWWQFWK
jgi:hypothetical protein